MFRKGRTVHSKTVQMLVNFFLQPLRTYLKINRVRSDTMHRLMSDASADRSAA